MTWDLGYLVGTAIFLSALVVLVAIQIAAKKFHHFLCWSTIADAILGFEHQRAAFNKAVAVVKAEGIGDRAARRLVAEALTSYEG